MHVYLDDLEVGHRLYGDVQFDLAEEVDARTELFTVQSGADTEDPAGFIDH